MYKPSQTENNKVFLSKRPPVKDNNNQFQLCKTYQNHKPLNIDINIDQSYLNEPNHWYFNNNYNSRSSVYNSCALAKNLINARLQKLQRQRELMQNANNNVNANPYSNVNLPYARDMSTLYRYRTLSQAGNQIASPHLYSYQYMQPIYYPMELPSNGEPLGVPRVELGSPVDKINNIPTIANGITGGDAVDRINQLTANNGNKGLGLTELMTLLTAMGKIQTDPNIKRKHSSSSESSSSEKESESDKSKEMKSEKKSNFKTKPISKSKHIAIQYKKENEINPEDIRIPNNHLKRNWWRLAKSFLYIYTFFSFARKYGTKSIERSTKIALRTKEITSDIAKVKEWLILILQPFWEEFKVFQELNISFQNIDPEVKIKERSQLIIALIKKFMENLLSKSNKLHDIPITIQKVLYSYIKDKAYFSKLYLTTFQVNRLNFDVFGATKNVNESQGGMLIAFFVICGITVQQILLHIKEVFPDMKDFPTISLTAKYIGSIIHYLTRDTFQMEPEMVKEILVLMNYYRNYHLLNEEVEQVGSGIKEKMKFKDKDEFERFLIPEKNISKFWEYNQAFIKAYKNFIFTWASKLARTIKKRYKDKDKDLKEKKGKGDTKSINKFKKKGE